MSKESKRLSKELFRHANLYYNDDEPEISDAEFDRMRDQLEALDPDDNFLKQVGAPVTENAMEHKIPMFSLAKCSNLAEFERWYSSLPAGTILVAQLKLDGSSLSGEYEKGKPKRYLTRGDGITGVDYTSNILRCHTPQIKKVGTFTGSVRGEAVIHKDLFTPENFPDKEDPTITSSNRRNSASGAIKKGDSKKVEYVDIVFYDVANGVRFKTEMEKAEYLVSLGLPTVETRLIKKLQDAADYYAEILAKREELPYMIDGIVFKVNNLALQESMGMSHERPKGQRALKFPSLQGVSTLRKLETKVGHTGIITCRAHYDMIVIDKREFTHANLNNFEYIKERDICIGDEVIVEICGDIIPKIVGVSKKGKKRVPIFPPKKCPACDTPVVRDGERRHSCNNEHCSGRAIRKMRNWVSKTGIKYYGPVAQKECYEAGVILTPVDLYTISKQALGAVIGGGNARNVLEEVEAHKKLPLKIFMGALGIPFLGRSNAQHLIDQGIDTLDKFRNIDTSRDYKGFDTNLRIIWEHIQILSPQIDALLAAGVEAIEPEKKKGKAMAGGIAGKKIVVTGTLSEGRKHFESLIESAGGTFSKSISGNTDYLLAGEKCGSKLTKAANLGVQILTEEEFMALLG